MTQTNNLIGSVTIIEYWNKVGVTPKLTDEKITETKVLSVSCSCFTGKVKVKKSNGKNYPCHWYRSISLSLLIKKVADLTPPQL